MYSIDTMVLVWGIQGRPGREKEGSLVKAFIEEANKGGHTLLVSSIVLCEFLAGVEDRDVPDVLDCFESKFKIAPFDARAAAKAAEIMKRRYQIAVKNGTAECHKCLKADIKILGSSIARKARFFVTDNKKDFETLANGEIEVRGLEGLQLSLFTEGEEVVQQETKEPASVMEVKENGGPEKEEAPKTPVGPTQGGQAPELPNGPLPESAEMSDSSERKDCQALPE